MPDVVERMSLSKVIKQENLKDWSVNDLNYEALSSTVMKDSANRADRKADGFTPLFLDNQVMTLNSAARTSQQGGRRGRSEGGGFPDANIPEGMICIAEEDLKKQLDDAYSRGTEEGRQVAERGLAHVFRALRDGSDSLISLRAKVMRECEGDLLKLSRMVAKKIILQEIRQDPVILANIVAATVNCCSEQDRITIRLSPEDYKAVMANRKKVAGEADDAGRVFLTPDESIKPGGCLVETPTGTVDARIDSQLDEVYTRCMEEGGIPQETTIGIVDGEQAA